MYCPYNMMPCRDSDCPCIHDQVVDFDTEDDYNFYDDYDNYDGEDD